MKKFILLVLALVLLFKLGELVVIGTMNYKGFCWEQKRYLTDEEKIRAVFNYQNQRSRLKIPSIGYRNHIKYESFDEYIRQYPDCCQKNGFGDVGAVTFWDKVFGYVTDDIIVINFNARYYDAMKQIRTSQIRFANRVNHCGIVVNR